MLPHKDLDEEGGEEEHGWRKDHCDDGRRAIIKGVRVPYCDLSFLFLSGKPKGMAPLVGLDLQYKSCFPWLIVNLWNLHKMRYLKMPQ